MQNVFLSDCDCNTIGTIGGSTSCTDTVGQCSCDTGYMGTTCEECMPDFYLSAASTCTSNVSTKGIIEKDNISSIYFLVCPNGWFYYDGACYLAKGEKVTHEDAITACAAFTDGKLFEPTSVEENAAIYDIMNLINGDTTEYWVGIKAFTGADPDGST